jgi:hypothetical protein
MNPPQEVVRQLFGRRLLESRDLTALRVHGAQDVIDRAVLAARIHSLKADEERRATIGVEQLLELPELVLIVPKLSFRVLVIRRGRP